MNTGRSVGSVSRELVVQLSKENAEAAVAVNLSHQRLASLQGIEAAASLAIVDASHNVLQNCNGLEGLRSLWSIDVSHNPLSSLSVFASSMALGILNVSHTPITFQDLMELGNTKLCCLTVEGCTALEGFPVHETEEDLPADLLLMYRVAAALPSCWCLNDRLIPSDVRKQALEFYHDGKGCASDFAK